MPAHELQDTIPAGVESNAQVFQGAGAVLSGPAVVRVTLLAMGDWAEPGVSDVALPYP